MVKIPDWTSPKNGQTSIIGKHEWSVSRLIELSKELIVFECQLNSLNLWKKYDVTLRQFVMHMKAVMDADLSYPIIIDEDGEIMDGRHRIMKAILEGKDTIKAVRFDENPSPCRFVED
jgi:hypothetical protein